MQKENANVTIRILLPVLAALSLAPFAQGQGATTSQTTPLQNIIAQSVPRFIKSAEGLDELTINFRDNSVTARGSQEAVAAFEKELHAADVPPVQYKTALRLVRYHVDKQGKYAQTGAELLPTVTTTVGVPALISIKTPGLGGYAVQVTPQRGADGAVTFTVEVQELGGKGEVIGSGQNELHVSLGTTVRITGMTDASDLILRRAVQQGQVVTDRGEYTGCYVEVTPALATHQP